MSPPAEPAQDSAPQPPVRTSETASTEAEELEIATDKDVSNTPQAAFGEDLPPDFWASEPLDAEIVAEQTASSSPPQTDTITDTLESEDQEGLEHDPRFKTMQSLFPGRIVQWQEAKPKAASEATEAGDENAVDLEAEDSDEEGSD